MQHLDGLEPLAPVHVGVPSGVFERHCWRDRRRAWAASLATCSASDSTNR